MPGFPTYCDSKGDSVTSDTPVPPEGPQKHFRLTEAKEDVSPDGNSQPQVSQGDTDTNDSGANPLSDEGERSGSLDPEGPYEDLESNGLEGAIGCDSFVPQKPLVCTCMIVHAYVVYVDSQLGQLHVCNWASVIHNMATQL